MDFIMGIKLKISEKSTLRDYQSYINYKFNLYDKICKILDETCERVTKKRKKDIIREMENRRVNSYKWYKEIEEYKVSGVYWEISLLSREEKESIVNMVMVNAFNEMFDIDGKVKYDIKIKIDSNGGKVNFTDPLIRHYIINELIRKLGDFLNMPTKYYRTNNYKDDDKYEKKDINYRFEIRKAVFEKEMMVKISDIIRIVGFKKEVVKETKIEKKEVVKSQKSVEEIITEIRKRYLEEKKKVMEKKVEEMRKINMIFKKPTKNKESEIDELKEYLKNGVCKIGIVEKIIVVYIRYCEEMREEELLLLYNYIEDLEKEYKRLMIDILKVIKDKDRETIEKEMIKNLKEDYKFIDYYSLDALENKKMIPFTVSFDNIKIGLDKEIENRIKEEIKVEIRIVCKDSLVAAYLITQSRLCMEKLIRGNNSFMDKEVLEDPMSLKEVNVWKNKNGNIVYINLNKNEKRKEFLINKLKEKKHIRIDGDRSMAYLV